MKSFYQLFNLTCDNNIEENIISQAKKCYSCDILYGDSTNFQADILYHEYRLYGTRGDRKFQLAIVDEVDSLLIDHKNYKTLLTSSDTKDMDFSLLIMRQIWTTIDYQR